jgi:hypothetical protein
VNNKVVAILSIQKTFWEVPQDATPKDIAHWLHPIAESQMKHLHPQLEALFGSKDTKKKDQLIGLLNYIIDDYPRTVQVFIQRLSEQNRIALVAILRWTHTHHTDLHTKIAIQFANQSSLYFIIGRLMEENKSLQDTAYFLKPIATYRPSALTELHYIFRSSHSAPRFTKLLMELSKPPLRKQRKVLVMRDPELVAKIIASAVAIYEEPIKIEQEKENDPLANFLKMALSLSPNRPRVEMDFILDLATTHPQKTAHIFQAMALSRPDLLLRTLRGFYENNNRLTILQKALEKYPKVNYLIQAKLRRLDPELTFSFN